jgi:hypothetical protein
VSTFLDVLKMAGVGIGAFLAASALWIVLGGISDRINAKRRRDRP